MTLCVAAECMDRGIEKVVFAADFAVESEFGKAEIEHKTAYIGKEEFPVLMAGSGTRARELMTYIDEVWKEPESENRNFLEACKEAIRRHKYNLADEYVSSRFGLPYVTLLGEMRQAVPDEQYREVMADIGRIRMGCDLIVVYFDGIESLVLRINDSGAIELCTNFAAIGSGLYLAEASLFQREHSASDSLALTIYHVYEAMKVGSLAPGVGKKFVMGIAHLGDDGYVRWFYLQPKYLKALESEYRKFGPRNISGQVAKREWIVPIPRHKAHHEVDGDTEHDVPEESQPKQLGVQELADQQQ